MDLLKAHVKGYSTRKGVYVAPHERIDRPGASKVAQPVHHHPRLSENGAKVAIHAPTHASSHTTWHNPNAVATFTPDGDVPLSLHGVPIREWKDHPITTLGWEYGDGVNDALHEPPFHLPEGKNASSGVIIEEPDGRIWVVHPTNKFGGYEATFPKGSAEPELSLQANAVKEAFEESGLEIEITGFIGDFERTTSVARMYKARRVGGSPVHAGWESQAVSLVPKHKLEDILNMWPDHAIIESITGMKLSNKKDQ